jgi:Flp pilus assembly protein TadG
MPHKSSERGQALVLIVLGIIALLALTGLAVDGGNAYYDRRKAQNAADSAAFAGALAQARGKSIESLVLDRAASNGYDNNGTSNTVSVSTAASPSGACLNGVAGLDVTVSITSIVNTYFSPIIGIHTLTNHVSATARACGSLVQPIAAGNAIVAMAASGKGFSTLGTPALNLSGGGIFSNSPDDPSAYCNGAASIRAPSVTSVGTTVFDCVNTISGGISQEQTDAQIAPSFILAVMPPKPLCNGTAFESPAGSGNWYPEHDRNGSRVTLSTQADMVFHSDGNFAPGVFCITNSPGNIHGNISGTDVTFYSALANFSVNFNGGGSFTASAPHGGTYSGVVLFLAAQTDADGGLSDSQDIALHGNGSAGVRGSVIAPSADVTLYGNSGLNGDDTQIVGYHVYAGGSASINLNYNPDDNYQAAYPEQITLVK